MFLLKDLSTILVDNISQFIYQVSSRVNRPSNVVSQFSFLICQGNYLSVSIFIHLTNSICNIKSSATVVEELRKISLVRNMRLVKFLSSTMIDDVTVSVNQISSGADARSSFVNKFSFGILFDNRISILIMVKVASNFMRIKIMFFNVERSRNFTLFIKITLLEHFFTIVIINNITFWINEIPSTISFLTIFIEVLSVFIRLSNENITFFISIIVSNYITLIESPRLNLRGSFNNLFIRPRTEVFKGSTLDHCF